MSIDFDWDEHNLFHIAQHGVTRDDVEAALTTNPVFVRDEIRNGEERRSHLGLATNGSILLVVTTERTGRTRTVTAFPAGRSLREYYRARKGESADGKTEDA